MKITERRKLQENYFNCVCTTTALRIKHTLADFKDNTLNGVPYRELYVDALAREEASERIIKMILGDKYFYGFFYNKAIKIRKKAISDMIKTYKELQH